MGQILCSSLLPKSPKRLLLPRPPTQSAGSVWLTPPVVTSCPHRFLANPHLNPACWARARKESPLRGKNRRRRWLAPRAGAAGGRDRAVSGSCPDLGERDARRLTATGTDPMRSRAGRDQRFHSRYASLLLAIRSCWVLVLGVCFGVGKRCCCSWFLGRAFREDSCGRCRLARLAVFRMPLDSFVTKNLSASRW